MPRGAAMPLLPLNAFFVFLCHICVDASVGQRWSCLIHHVSLMAERNNVGTLVSITEVAFESGRKAGGIADAFLCVRCSS